MCAMVSYLCSVFFGLLAAGLALNFLATFAGSLSFAASPIHAERVLPSSLAWSSNAAHQSEGWVILRRSIYASLCDPQ